MWKWGSPPKNSGVGRREANWIYYFSMFCGKAKRYESLNSRAKFSHEIFILAHLPWYSIWQSSTVKPNRYFPRQVASLSSSFDNRKHPTGGFDDNRHTKPAMNKFLLFFSLWRGGKDESLERKMPKNKEKYFNLGEFTRRETINWIDFCDFSKENRRGDEKCHTNQWQDGTTEFSTFLSSFFLLLFFFCRSFGRRRWEQRLCYLKSSTSISWHENGAGRMPITNITLSKKRSFEGV